jgi:ribose 5-phosphate isomerase B
MKIAVGADHRGVPVTSHVLGLLRSAGHDVEYFGRSDTQRCDYPDQAYLVAKAVADGRADRGILLSGSGIGMAITANKLPGVRAIVGHDEWMAIVSRSHHDTNVLTLPADMLGVPMIRIIVDRWLATDFEGGRHQKRIDKITAVENGGDPTEMPSSAPKPAPAAADEGDDAAASSNATSDQSD